MLRQLRLQLLAGLESYDAEMARRRVHALTGEKQQLLDELRAAQTRLGEIEREEEAKAAEEHTEAEQAAGAAPAPAPAGEAEGGGGDGGGGGGEEHEAGGGA